VCDQRPPQRTQHTQPPRLFAPTASARALAHPHPSCVSICTFVLVKQANLGGEGGDPLPAQEIHSTPHRPFHADHHGHYCSNLPPLLYLSNPSMSAQANESLRVGLEAGLELSHHVDAVRMLTYADVC